jgi:diguanylate cyclase (GGDEF)-like protein
MAYPVRSVKAAGWSIVLGGAMGAVATAAVGRTRMRHLLAAVELDDLTGLGNRRRLQQVAASPACAGRTAWVAFGDLDRFKAVNDTRGHHAGDIVLRGVADVLRRSVRPGDVVCRVGGDEFVIVLWSCSASEATRVMDRVRRRLAAAVTDAPCTMSVGLAPLRADGRLAAAVVAADQALVAAKQAGGDRVVTFANQPSGRPKGIS